MRQPRSEPPGTRLFLTTKAQLHWALSCVRSRAFSGPYSPGTIKSSNPIALTLTLTPTLTLTLTPTLTLTLTPTLTLTLTLTRTACRARSWSTRWSTAGRCSA